MMDFKTSPSRRPNNISRHEPPALLASVPPAQEAQVHKRRIKPITERRNWKKYLLILLLIGLIGWLAYGYISTKNQLTQVKTGQSSNQNPTEQLLAKVGTLVDLPAGETPTIATVNNASKLKSQAFFANAKDGDKVLIYNKSGKGVLYRPSTNKVIEYSTVNLSGGTGQ